MTDETAAPRQERPVRVIDEAKLVSMTPSGEPKFIVERAHWESGRADDLVSWLRHQLDEDERAVRTRLVTEDAVVDAGYGSVVERERSETRWSSSRLVAEVAAKRAILDAYEEAVPFYEKNRSAPAGELHGLRTAIKYLAAPYSDRPGYQDQWKP